VKVFLTKNHKGLENLFHDYLIFAQKTILFEKIYIQNSFKRKFKLESVFKIFLHLNKYINKPFVCPLTFSSYTERNSIYTYQKDFFQLNGLETQYYRYHF